MRMRHTVICGLPRSTVFCHIISQMARLKNKTEHKMCVSSSSIILSEELRRILRRVKRDMTNHVYRSSCKVSVIVVGFY